MQVSAAESRTCGESRHKRALLSNQLRPSSPLFLFKEKKKFLPLTAAQRSDTTILIQLIRQNDLKIKQKFSKIDDSTIITRTPAQVKGSRIAP